MRSLWHSTGSKVVHDLYFLLSLLSITFPFILLIAQVYHVPRLQDWCYIQKKMSLAEVICQTGASHYQLAALLR